jgi:hypothetical protein
MKRSLVLIGVLMGASAALATDWSENFDSYENGSEMHGQGGWHGWDGNASAGAKVTDAQSRSSPNSVAIETPSDLVHDYLDAEVGRWVYTAYQYIPSDTFSGTERTFFILLNIYDDGGPYNWSTEMRFRADTDKVHDDFVSGKSLPIKYDEWVEIRVEIDLDNDKQKSYYGGNLLSENTWRRGDNTAALDIAAVDLYAENPDPVYYDDLSLVEVKKGACCVGAECSIQYADDCANGGGTYQGDGTECDENTCSPCGVQVRGDSNCDGGVDFNDIDCFVASLIGQDSWDACGHGGGCDYVCVNDINQDDSVDFNDIDGFVECLINGGCP